MSIPTTTFMRRLAVLCTLALTVFGLSVASASAGTHESIKTKRGSVAFNHKGEILTAEDSKGDGIGIMAHLFWKVKKNKTVSATVIDGSGADGLPNAKNLDIRDGTVVNLKLCYTNNGVVFKCSKVQKATA